MGWLMHAQFTYHARRFAHQFERLPGTSGYPNLHLLQHLPETMRDYGPPSALSCFSFERMNKSIGDTKTNNRDVERTFSRAWSQLDTLASLPHLTKTWATYTDDEQALFAELHATTVATARSLDNVTIAAQVACDRSRAAAVVVHETAVLAEQVRAQFEPMIAAERALRDELAERRAQKAARAAARQARAAADARRRQLHRKYSSPPRGDGIGLHVGAHSSDDDRSEGDGDVSPPGLRRAGAGAGAPALPDPPRLRLTGAEPFIGQLLLTVPHGAARPSKAKKTSLRPHELDLSDAAAEELHQQLLTYFERIYACKVHVAGAIAGGAVRPRPPAAPSTYSAQEVQVWQAACRRVLAARAPPEGQFTGFVLSPICPQAKRLCLFDSIIGSENSRQARSSYVMVLTGTRICPARCLGFYVATVTLTRSDGTVLAPITHHLVNLRCLYPPPPPQHHHTSRFGAKRKR
jgi:hypothetical protein